MEGGRGGKEGSLSLSAMMLEAVRRFGPENCLFGDSALFVLPFGTHGWVSGLGAEWAGEG